MIRRALRRLDERWAHARREIRQRFGKGMVRTRYGVRMQKNWHDTTFRMCVRGSYGTALADLIRRERREFLFLDIGANQGLYSLIAAGNPCCRGALAFEPVAATFARLEANVRHNGLTERIVCVHAGVSSSRGTADIFVDAGHSGVASLACNGTVPSARESIELIAADEVDALVAERAGGVPLIVKIDVEGHEQVVVAELLRSAHAGRIEKIFYEVDERWTDPGAIQAALEAVGFTRFEKHGRNPRHYDVLASRAA